jgi:hypothetical protein
MALATKPKPKAASAAPKGKTKPATAKPKTKPEAAPKAATKPKEIFAEGTLVTFKGYRNNLPADEVVFKEGDILYLLDAEESDDNLMYTAIKAEDIEEYEVNGDDNVNGGEVHFTEIAELKGSALTNAQEAYIPVKVVGKLGEALEDSDDLIAVAKSFSNEVHEAYFYLGGALAMILQKGIYLKSKGGEYEGEEAFNDFCQDTFGFKASKGRQLARLYTTLANLENFTVDMLKGIGWSIAAKAEKYITNDNVGEVLETASTTTQRNVDVVLREKFANTESNVTASGRAASRGDSIQKKTLSFRFDEDVAETVEMVLSQAQKQLGVRDAAAALEAVLVQWAGDHVEVETAKKRILAKAAKAAKAKGASAKKTPEKAAA